MKQPKKLTRQQKGKDIRHLQKEECFAADQSKEALPK